MATAWPHLHQLSLVPQKLADPPKPLATLAGLVAFAQNYLRLRSLRLALDTNPHHLPTYFADMRPGLGMRQRKLAKLEVGRSPIEDPVVAAAFLSDLFPKLLEITTGFSPLEDLLYFQGPGDADDRQQILADAVHADRWAEVEWVYLPHFVQIRKQERKCAYQPQLLEAVMQYDYSETCQSHISGTEEFAVLCERAVLRLRALLRWRGGRQQ